MIKSLTSLRGIFILIIFLHHAGVYHGGGTMGVALFFILSGFCLTLGYKEKVTHESFSYKTYIVNRFIKLYPLHVICLFASIPYILQFFSWKQIPLFFINASLLQTWIPEINVYFSYNSVSWYLADTMFFAVLFPFLLRWIFNASNKGKALLAIIFAALYVVVAIFIPTEMHHAILYISPYMRLMDFVLGIYLALGFWNFRVKPSSILNNSILTHVLVCALIALLVIESCMLSEDAVLFAPVYWPFVTFLILIAALSEVGGGKKYFRTNISNVLAN